ncbi:xanthine dehydrogenase small subunit [Brachybacterium vulturis]|uniref:Xanthine dehydrogenase small subunit n=1 Tax=Brachybacterium vulturis TaxID=2017484 RepID=A0A291GRS4_9MICO|nr:FAD binding domain-containing protein [Brachybacterium vulturis]ATG52897.1 xanthine dehydrogenase small subunit [Brachybacterium vulturis]
MEPTQITVNGRPLSTAGAAPHTNLLTWLRDQGLTGAKEGCAEGECGACAVLVARPDGEGGTRWTSLNSCLPPALAFADQEIVTAEGLGSAPRIGEDAELHPVQREMAERGGSQCGFCTPGFVCSMAAEYYRPERHAAAKAPSGAPADEGGDHDHECGANGFDLHALSGNLCRCTGYRPIRDAAYALGDPAQDDPLAQRREHPAPRAPSVTVASGEAEFHRPADLAELLRRCASAEEVTLVAGATDVGVETNILHRRPPLQLAIDHLSELRTLTETPEQLEIGAALTLSEIERDLDGRVPLLAQLFPQFASRLIRNSATLGGNIGTGSPIGDSAPALLALDARIVLASVDGEREVPISEFFTGYRQTVRTPQEIIRALRIPLPVLPTSDFVKIAKRRFDDISSVAVAIAVQIEDGRVRRARIGLGGVAATPLRGEAAEEILTGAPWTAPTVRAAAAELAATGTPMDDHRASSRYRRAMLEQSLLRFFARSRPTAPMEVPR